MSEEIVIQHCAPTLAGLKTGSIFSCDYQTKAQVIREIRRLNQQLVPKGLRVVPLRYGESRVLIFVFRPARLRRDLTQPETALLLQALGYGGPDRCVLELIEKLNSQAGFPHEIGLFLGYPLEDVIGFMENRGACCKCVGCWKVYGDETTARLLFHRYKRCTEIYRAQWQKGVSIARLTVAASALAQ